MEVGGDCISNVIAITGATGFIGRHLIRALLESERAEIRILSRGGGAHKFDGDNLTRIVGDLADISSLERLVTPGCTLINLAYSYSSSEEQNLAYARNLAKACYDGGVRRVLHCSTASVFGKASCNLINESTPCSPGNEYGRAKLKIEEIFRSYGKSSYQLYIIRPTSVVGVGGLTLSKLIDEIEFEGCLKNYIRGCVYGRRRLNLVGVNTLTAAMLFLMKSDTADCGEYIVSQDDAPENDYEYFSDLVYRETEVKRLLPRVNLPHLFLEILLKIKGRAVVDVNRYYSSTKLINAGFAFSEDFRGMLATYIADYISHRPVRSPSK